MLNKVVSFQKQYLHFGWLNQITKRGYYFICFYIYERLLLWCSWCSKTTWCKLYNFDKHLALENGYTASAEMLGKNRFIKWFCILLPKVCRKYSEKFLYQSLYRSSRLQMFFKIGVLENFANFIGKHLCWSLFLIQVFRRYLKETPR